MSILQQLRHELKEKGKEDSYTWKQVLLLQNAWLKDNQDNGCYACHSKQNLSVDHIIPVWLLQQFGIDVEHEFLEEDLQVLCRRCNQYKGNRLDFANPKTKQLLLKYIERV